MLATTMYMIKGGAIIAYNQDGKGKRLFKIGGWIGSSPIIGKDGTIYVGSWDHNLYAFQ